MSSSSKIYLSVITGLFLLLAACNTFSKLQSQNNPHLQPSANTTAFDRENYGDFSDYLEQTKDMLQANKVFMDKHSKQRELDAARPFELKPAKHCHGSLRNGVLLIHGLADMPFAMRDLAQAFSRQCFLVRTILLPGHGARAADLISVNRQDWLNAVKFGVETLKQDVDQVYVGGFSLGGLLSVYVTAKDSEIKGVFAFSPALALDSNWQIRQSVWLRHVIDWIDKDEQDDYARFEAMPTNAIAETYLLTDELRQLLNEQPLATPVFLVQSSDDPIIDTVTNRTYFSESFIHSASKLINYQQNPSESRDPKDKRVQYVNSYLPEQRIVGFSHQATHISPANSHYGASGQYRNCGINTGRSEKDVNLCLTSKEVWRGELFDDSSILSAESDGLMRLTFNPYFDQLIQQALLFIHESESTSVK